MRLAVRQRFVTATSVISLALSAALTAAGQRGALTVAPTPAGQTPPPPHGTGLIVGQVVDGTSGKGIGGALVTLNFVTSTPVAAPSGRGQPTAPAALANMSNVGRVLADGEGRFVFHDLPVGRGNLNATAPGYTQGAYGARQPNGPSRPIVLTDGERFGDATIRLWKLSTIAGSVVDETGDPLVGVTVNMLRFTTDSGTRRSTGGPATTTDDRGIYHFLVQAGDYVVVVPATSTSMPVSTVETFERAMATPGQVNDVIRNLSASGAPMPNGSGTRVGAFQFETTGTMSRNAPPVAPNGPLLAYQTTYYPNAFSPSQAQTISLAPGEDHPNVDITMRLVPTARVIGTVVGPDGPAANLGLRLVPADSQDPGFNGSSPTAVTLSDAVGAFTFLGVPSGQYELQVTRMPRPMMMPPAIVGGPPGPAPDTEPTLWARLPVNVEGGDVAGLVVTLHTGVRISGRVEFDGSAPKPAPERLVAGTVIMQDLDNQGQPLMPARLSQDGQFRSQSVIPGHYLVMIGGGFGQGWFLKSVMANGHDLSASPQLIDTDIKDAIATFTDHPNQIDGSLEMATPTPDSPVMVVYFPSNYQAWLAGGTAGRLSGSTRADQSGHFTLHALPAGEYDFAAIPSDFSANWKDPKILDAISREATHVSLGEQDHRTVQLKPLTIR